MTSVRVDLTGAGASFPYPLYARWFNEYAPRSGVRINYRTVGSRAGIADLLAAKVDFAATDVPLTAKQLTDAHSSVFHVPTVLGAVAITYNLPSLERPLRLTGDVLAEILLGRIARWNDGAIAALNPGVSLPATPVHVVHRQDGSGTTFILADYLSAVSAHWAAEAGRGTSVKWAVGSSVNGSEGMVAEVKSTFGAIGYLEVVYARQNRMPIAHIRNRHGRFVSPMPFEIASAAAGTAAFIHGTGDASSAHAISPGVRTSTVDAPGEHAYPLSSYTWIVLAPAALGPAKTRQLVDFLDWALTDGADLAAQLGYVALPGNVTEVVLRGLDSISPATQRR